MKKAYPGSEILTSGIPFSFVSVIQMIRGFNGRLAYSQINCKIL